MPKPERDIKKIGAERLPDATIIEGEVDTVLFRSEQTGYAVLGIDAQDSPIVVGSLAELREGETVRFFGRWSNHPDYGPRFVVDHYETVLPQQAKAIEKYLSSGLIRGIGPVLAKKLISRFGDDTLRVLEEQPERVAAIRGIGRRKAQRFSAEMQAKKEYEALSLFLSPYGIGAARIMRINRLYGSSAVERIRANPYALADDIPDVGFVTADRIAKAMGIDPQSPERLASALHYVLNQAIGQGHTGIPLVQAQNQAGALLGFTVLPESEGVTRFLQSSTIRQLRLSQDDPAGLVVMPATLFATEQSIATHIKRLLKSLPFFKPDLMNPNNVRLAMDHSPSGEIHPLTDEQQEAIMKALSNSLTIVTGGPGTGKTTLVMALCRIIENSGGRLLLAAPTGRAARRLGEATGRDAKTLHRLLEIAYTTDDPGAVPVPGRNADRPLETDVIIVDESSMIDVFLMNSLLSAIRSGTRLVMIGDADQLPSVGPGQVLRDLIASAVIPVIRLTRIFRQATGSLIVENAHRIRDGQMPRLDQSLDSSFLLILKESAEEMAEAAVRLIEKVIPGKYGFNPMLDVQVLSPSRKGPCGIIALNQELQQVLNPLPRLRTDQIKPHPIFRLGDRVMQTRNDYAPVVEQMTTPLPEGPEQASLNRDSGIGPEQEDSTVSQSGIFNGETGTIWQIDSDTQVVTVQFEDGRLIRYDLAKQEDLVLSYAVTVHKSQGSEYPAVILTLPPGAPGLINRSILYTAVTRARQNLFLITSRETLAVAIRRKDSRSRQTALFQLLKHPDGFGNDG